MVAHPWLAPTDRDVLTAFGRRAKTEVLVHDDAVELAARLGVHLYGHGGTPVRPILDGGRAVLLVETLDDRTGWRVVPRDMVKRH